MRKIGTVLALAAMTGLAGIMLSGCASSPDNGAERWPGSSYRPAPAAPAPEAPAPEPETPVTQAPTPAAPQTPQAPRPIAGDTCGASALQYLIGKPRTDIPVPLQPSMRRVVCSSCVVTQDYRASRQTIIFDTDSGLIKSVGCG